MRELPLLAGDDAPLRIDLLFNNAGVLHSGERFGHVSEANLLDSLRINAVGPFLLVQELAPLLADGARVADLSSQLGSIGRVTRFGTPSYAISKAAQNMATAQLAQVLAPRGIEGRMHPHAGVLVVVQPGAAQLPVVQREPERLDQVQPRAGVGAQPDHVAGVGRDLGRMQDDVEHRRAGRPCHVTRATAGRASRGTGRFRLLPGPR